MKALLQRAVVSLVVLSGCAAAAAGEPPRSIVERLNQTLLEVMRNAGSLGYEGRYQRLAPVLADAFNFPLMARISVGRYWRDFDPAQQRRLADTFARLSIATFAARFDGYDGETFKVTAEEPQPRDTMLVHNELIQGSGKPISLNYLMRRSDDGWQVIDVFLEAKYSELAVKRAEYSTIVERDGFDALIAVMERKIVDLAGGTSS